MNPLGFRSASRRTGAIALAGVSAVALTACGVGEPVDREARAQVASDAKTLRLAHVYDAGHPVEECGVSTLNEELEGSGLAVDSFPAGQLGSEAEALEQVANGSVDLAIAGPAFLGAWHEPVEVLDAAFLFDDMDEFEDAAQTELVQGLFDDLYESSGIKALSHWYYGTRHITSNKEIDSADDLQGLKIRTPDAPLAIKNLEALGGTATPMSLDEVYLALQQGVIDGQENPTPTIATSKFNEVQDYINLSGHLVQVIQVTTGRTVWEGLTEHEQQALQDALTEAAAAVRECVEESEASVLEEWKAGDGIKVNEDVDRDALAAAAEKVMREQSWGHLYEQIKGDS